MGPSIIRLSRNFIRNGINKTENKVNERRHGEKEDEKSQVLDYFLKLTTKYCFIEKLKRHSMRSFSN